ncbi:pentatricopeptide repeat (PPR-like) superfamily protein [Actinidia rufa]|uniref:Pentatricopeptide repeat (PPR-like) superfamily protein n=1 Tax=Actinidia rufa TaxID=165716 RepID=A0A7J0DRW4_9ERIC|nr:pentatricopeptide repeat (PPR-like) superfamily protein [Actinidia rufa]
MEFKFRLTSSNPDLKRIGSLGTVCLLSTSNWVRIFPRLGGFLIVFFDCLFVKDVVSWTSMISGYIRVGKPRNSIRLFSEMLDFGVEPNGFTLSALIKACSEIGDVNIGRCFLLGLVLISAIGFGLLLRPGHSLLLRLGHSLLLRLGHSLLLRLGHSLLLRSGHSLLLRLGHGLLLRLGESWSLIAAKSWSSFEDGESAALAVQSGNRGKKSDGRSGWSNGSSSSSRGKGVQCYYCKEFGHVKRDCPLRKDKGKKCDDASSCNSLVVADDGDCLTVSEGINTSSHDEWILDSGCTMHVCSKKEFFDTFQERDGGSLFLGDGTPCKIQGVGNVKIKMFDGAVRTLGGVVYIPKLRRNLISLSRMDSNGCKYFAGGGAMKITRGGKVLLMKGEKCEGLYRLIGKTVYTTKVWKRCAQGSGYPRCESFAAKTKLCFQVADGSIGFGLLLRPVMSSIAVGCIVFYCGWVIVFYWRPGHSLSIAAGSWSSITAGSWSSIAAGSWSLIAVGESWSLIAAKSSFEDGESAALAVQSGNRGKKSDGRSGWSNGSSSSSRGKGVQCYYCKEFGHVKRDCPLRKDKGKKCDDASSCNSLVEFFDTFQERDGGSLFLGDGTPCKIQGVGNVKIKMFDGAVRTLGGVVYIPKLRRNLISLSRMDSNGCKYFAGGGAMKITRGGKVLMKGEKCEGLYRLIGKTVYTTKVWKRCGTRKWVPKVFDELLEPDAICWTSVISALTRNDSFEDALGFFYSMQRIYGLSPDEFTFGTVLMACGNLGWLRQEIRFLVVHCSGDTVKGVTLTLLLSFSGNWMRSISIASEQFFEPVQVWQLLDGKEVHCPYLRRGGWSDVIVESALVDLYAKCGCIDFAYRIFVQMPVRNLITWNSMICGFAQNGQAGEALRMFDEMVKEGINPDYISFIGVLFACSHTGLVDQGRGHFTSMTEQYGIKAGIEHYNCMVDLLGCSGQIEEAEYLINSAEFKDDSSLWAALLGACSTGTNSVVAERIAKKMMELEPDYHLSYVLLANVYRAVGRWSDALKIWRLMQGRGVKKMLGKNWI